MVTCGIWDSECVSDPQTFEANSIECDKCKKRFHYPCVNHNGGEPFLSRKRSIWLCRTCDGGKGRRKKSKK